MPVQIVDDRVDHIVGQPPVFVDRPERLVPVIPQAHPAAVRTEPEPVLPVLVDIIHRIITQRIGVRGIVDVAAPLTALGPAPDSLVVGGEPEIAQIILQNGFHKDIDQLRNPRKIILCGVIDVHPDRRGEEQLSRGEPCDGEYVAVVDARAVSGTADIVFHAARFQVDPVDSLVVKAHPQVVVIAKNRLHVVVGDLSAQRTRLELSGLRIEQAQSLVVGSYPDLPVLVLPDLTDDVPVEIAMPVTGIIMLETIDQRGIIVHAAEIGAYPKRILPVTDNREDRIVGQIAVERLVGQAIFAGGGVEHDQPVVRPHNDYVIEILRNRPDVQNRFVEVVLHPQRTVVDTMQPLFRRADPDIVVVVAIKARNHFVPDSLRNIFGQRIDPRSRGIEHHDSLADGSHPNAAHLVLNDGPDEIGRNLRSLEMVRTRQIPVDPEQPLPVGRQPYVASIVLHDRTDLRGQDIPARNLDAKLAERLTLLVEQPDAPARSHPEPAVGILTERKHEIIAQRGLHAALTAINLERITVETIESVLGTEPHESLPVLQDGKHAVLRKAVFDLITFKRICSGIRPCDRKERRHDTSHPNMNPSAHLFHR